MSGGPGFLARWSRRKVEARRDEPAPPEGEPPVEAPAEPDAVTSEELAALPKLEDFTPQTDIAAFLRKGVPEALTKAALRRMWSLDPAIRDHVGEALDYAYDWNVPGGVPGNGPLLPTDDVAAMVRRVFGEAAEPPLPEDDGPLRIGAHSPRPCGEGPGAGVVGTELDASKEGAIHPPLEGEGRERSERGGVNARSASGISADEARPSGDSPLPGLRPTLPLQGRVDALDPEASRPVPTTPTPGPSPQGGGEHLPPRRHGGARPV